MWTHRYALVCVIGAMLLCSVSLDTVLRAQDPSALPRIAFGDLTYLGAFRLPDQFVNNDGFTIGGHPVTYNPGRNSLFIGSRNGNLAEVNIPAPVNSSNIASLPFATFLQGFHEPTEGNLSQVASEGVSIDGLLVHNNKLYGTASIYYDANNTQRVSHYSHSTVLSNASFVGMRQVWLDGMSGFVSGYMATVPAEWQARLGGPALTGQCCIPIAWRTSWGPSAFAWNPADIASTSPVAASPLLYYDHTHPSLGRWDTSNPVYGGTTQINGLAVIAGSRTALFFGRNGTGPFCYGNGTSNQSLVGTIGPDNELYCYDPAYSSKGQHAYPYNYQIWAYDLNDLAAVRAGTRQPWDLQPYGVWPFNLPMSEPQVRIGGIGYDSARQIIYVVQMYADQDGYGYRPLVHALKVGGGAAGTPLPGVDTTPLPPLPTPVSTKVESVTVTPDRTAPQAAGTTVNWTATAAGGIAPYQYKWLVYENARWTVKTSWTASNTYAWTPSAADPNYRVGVWVKSNGNSADTEESSASMQYAIGAGGSASSSPPPSSPSARATGVALVANTTAPKPTGTTITFTATPTGGTAPHQYKWLVYENARWTVKANWATSSSFAWTPTTADPNYRVGVWVRSAGNSVDAEETSTSIPFAIATATATSAPPPSPTARVSSVGLTASLPAPQQPGMTITFTALPTGGAAPHQYKWLVYENARWTVKGTWTSSNSYAWTPVSADPNYRVGVWVRSNGNIADAEEASASVLYPIAGTATSTAGSTGTIGTGGKVTSVTVSANRIAPQPLGVTTMFTATPAGGTGTLQFKWLVYDGASWIAQGGWTTANVFNWMPTRRDPNYRVGVWVRSATNSADQPEASNWLVFPIQ